MSDSAIQLNVTIRPDQKEALNDLVPYGVLSAVYMTMTDLLITLLQQEDGQLYLGMLIKGEFNLETLMKLDAIKTTN